MNAQELEIIEGDRIETALRRQNITEQVLAELKTYSSLKINGIDDAEGYQAVKSAATKCRNTRTLAVKICKAGRADAVAEQKRWLSKENEIVDTIESVESPLKAMIDAIDAEKENQRQIKLRRGQLPLRQEQLKAINMELTEEQILSYSDESWYVWMLEQKTRISDEREAKLKAAEEALQKEIDAVAEANAKAQADIKRQQELQEVAEKVAAKARQDAEEEYQKKIREEQHRAIKEREEFEQRIMMEAKAKEDAEIADRIEAERKLAAAPDKERLTIFQNNIKSAMDILICKTKEANDIISQANLMLNKVIQFIEVTKQKL